MRKRELTKRRWPLRAAMLGGLILGVSFVLFHLLFETKDAGISVPAPSQVLSAPPPATVQDDTRPPAVEDAPPSVPNVADLAFRCGELLDPVEREYPNADDASEDCRSALEARFSPAQSAAGLFPFARPMTWSDVFEDVAAGFEAVTAAVGDPACEVAAHDLRPDLAERCAARDMAEIAVLGEVCARLVDGFADLYHRGGIDPERYLTMLDADARDSALARLDAGSRFTGNIQYLNEPRRIREALNAPLADTGEYWRQRERVDEVYFRTAWLRSRCEDQRETLAAMLPRADVLDGLMQRAAGFGDEFALSHNWQGRWRAMELQDSNLLLGWVHLGQSHAAAVEAELRNEMQRAIDELDAGSPYFQSRLRVLEMADIECPSPCTPEQLRTTEKRFEREIRIFRVQAYGACGRGDCEHSDALLEVDRQLALARAERTRTGMIAGYAKRAEALRVRFALAVEGLAAERGVPLDVAMLRRVLANPDVPRHLDSTEVERLRTVAQEMVARALTHRTSAIPPAQP